MNENVKAVPRYGRAIVPVQTTQGSWYQSADIVKAPSLWPATDPL